MAKTYVQMSLLEALDAIFVIRKKLVGDTRIEIQLALEQELSLASDYVH